jgi:hypothetical protein
MALKRDRITLAKITKQVRVDFLALKELAFKQAWDNREDSESFKLQNHIVHSELGYTAAWKGWSSGMLKGSRKFGSWQRDIAAIAWEVRKSGNPWNMAELPAELKPRETIVLNPFVFNNPEKTYDTSEDTESLAVCA